MKTLLFWYIDTTGDTRIQVKEVPESSSIEFELDVFRHHPGVATVLEIYTLKATHRVFTTPTSKDVIVKTIQH